MIYIFVEGDDEQRFIGYLSRACPVVSGIPLQTIQYAHGKARKRALAVIRALQSQGVPYMILGDLDQAACPMNKKKELANALVADVNSIAIVCPEIEGWYLAGVDIEKRKALGVSRDIGIQPERCTKEKFKRLTPKRFQTKTPFMLELLKHYECETASSTAPSFRYAIGKLKVLFPDAAQ